MKGRVSRLAIGALAAGLLLVYSLDGFRLVGSGALGSRSLNPR
jgi:hypothetical protein